MGTRLNLRSDEARQVAEWERVREQEAMTRDVKAPAAEIRAELDKAMAA